MIELPDKRHGLDRTGGTQAARIVNYKLDSAIYVDSTLEKEGCSSLVCSFVPCERACSCVRMPLLQARTRVRTWVSMRAHGGLSISTSDRGEPSLGTESEQTFRASDCHRTAAFEMTKMASLVVLFFPCFLTSRRT
eukprot:3175823-Pleurochrysis_carterae.AAC.1